MTGNQRRGLRAWLTSRKTPYPQGFWVADTRGRADRGYSAIMGTHPDTIAA